jgi:uncharacterized protein (DUF1778 family)
MALMRVQSVRFGSWQWATVTRAAGEDGVSASQFIRDSAFARAVLLLAQAGEADQAFVGAFVDAMSAAPELVSMLREALEQLEAADSAGRRRKRAPVSPPKPLDAGAATRSTPKKRARRPR